MIRNFMFAGLAILVLASCSKKTNVEPELTFLRTSGHYMVNEQGDTVLLRGVGLGNWLLPEGYMWHFGGMGDRPRKIEKIIEDLTSPEFSKVFWDTFRRNYIMEEDIRRVKELGFNSVRPALNARVFMTEGDTAVFIEENFALLDSLVTWCGRHGIYVILDMHGAPGGQTGQNIDDSPNNEPELFMDPLNEQRLTRLWVKLAERYKNSPVIAGYDLLNEPLPRNTGAAEKYGHMVEPMYKRLTQEIRKVDKRHMIILEGVNWSNDWSIFTEPFDDNLVYQFHYYCWSNPDHLNDVSHYIQERERLNAPVWVGETGERNPSIYFATTQYFEANNIGWSYWPWKKIDNRQVIYSVNPPEGYEQIIAYTREGEKPPKELAEKVFTELLENIRIENCEFLYPISQSLLRQVPARIYAVNYGHDGEGVSYGVNDEEPAAFYRTSEPVKVELIERGSRRRRGSQQAIRLSDGEWTAYTFYATQPFDAEMLVRAKASKAGSEIHITFNGEVFSKVLNDTAWTDFSVTEPLSVQQENSMKVEVLEGEVLFHYFDLEEK